MATARVDESYCCRKLRFLKSLALNWYVAEFIEK
jgi:hypothetical protein